jgi:NhaA family Na+:H+ antiporter
MIDLLHPWVSFVFMPVFALANSGVEINANAVGDRVAIAVAVALVLGKTLGILGFSWLAVILGIGRLPQSVTWRMMVGASVLGGIGFTMALFIAGLAYPGSPELLAASKIGILAGSLVATVIGGSLLWFTLPRSEL